MLALAAAADSGFEPSRFAHALGALEQIADEAFAEYDVPTERITMLRRRFHHWRNEILGNKDS